jgi:hypothetical protein
MGFNRAREPWRPSPVFHYAFNLAGVNNPRLCFISTGTGDKHDSITNFYAAFAGSNVRASHLALFDKFKGGTTDSFGDVQAYADG